MNRQGMIVQHRAINESIVIGKAGDVLTKPIVVTVVEAKKYHCRLGVEAQSNLVVYRSESQILPVVEASPPVVGTPAELMAEAGL